MRIINLKCESDSLSYDQSIRAVSVSSETADKWVGKPVANPACPELEWPKFAWKEVH